MALIFGLLGRGFSQLGAARGKGKASGGFGPTHPYTYFIYGF